MVVTTKWVGEYTIISDAKTYIQWSAKKLKINDAFFRNEKKLSTWKLNRGQIRTCFFGENIGYEKSKLEARPCIIVSCQQINHESGNVIVVPLSKNIKYISGTDQLKYPYHYVLKKSEYPNLAFDSAVQCEDIRCVSKARLCNYICNVKPDDMKEIRKRLKNALQIWQIVVW